MSEKFNYSDLDDEEKFIVYKSNMRSIENLFREKYIERLERFNKSSLQNNPEPFRFLLGENCSIVILIVPKEFDDSIAAASYVLSTPGTRNEVVKVLYPEDLIDLDTYGYHITFLNERILPSLGFDSSQIIFELRETYKSFERRGASSFIDSNFDIDSYSRYHDVSREIIQIIMKEMKNFKRNSETKLSYFAKDAYKFPFSLLDLKPLIGLVNDEDFTYQLDQAMAAYHQNLFLPCAATLGVVLETLCLKILKIHGIKVKSADTQLGRLIEKLTNERITTRRDNARLEVAYKMRNIASHSNPGATLKEDCHLMLNVINTIAHEYITDK